MSENVAGLSADIKALLDEEAKRVAGVSAGEDGVFSFRDLMNVVLIVFNDGRVTQADFEPVTQYVEQLFEEFVRPFDLPYIPDFLEGKIDDAIKASIRPILQKLFDTYTTE